MQNKTTSNFEIRDFNEIFKVYFKGSSNITPENLNLTFFWIQNQELIIPISIFSDFLVKYNVLVKNKKATSVNNIKQVLPLGKATNEKITQFMILLYSIKSIDNDLIRAGLLIGNHKEKGFMVLGVWPFNSIKSASFVVDNYLNLFQVILSDASKFQDLLLIS
jgi:hypothetical protein